MGSDELQGIVAQFRASGREIVASEDVASVVRSKLAEHHQLYVDMLLRGVGRGDRTAMRLYPELVGIVGGTRDLQAVLLGQLGVASLDAARRIMDLARDASAEDAAALYERSLRFVHDYRTRHGMPRLIDGEAIDAVVETNGHTNGTNGVSLVRSNGSGPPG